MTTRSKARQTASQGNETTAPHGSQVGHEAEANRTADPPTPALGQPSLPPLEQIHERQNYLEGVIGEFRTAIN